MLCLISAHHVHCCLQTPELVDYGFIPFFLFFSFLVNFSRSYTFVHTLSYNIHIYIHIHTYKLTYIHTYIHTYKHRYIHKHIHTYIYTYILVSSICWGRSGEVVFDAHVFKSGIDYPVTQLCIKIGGIECFNLKCFKIGNTSSRVLWFV